MRIERIWAMPNRSTFTIAPIKQLLAEEVPQGFLRNGDWIDPFAGNSSVANLSNDLNPNARSIYHQDALDFLAIWDNNSAMGCLYDPPYSMRQASECYQSYGKKYFDHHPTSMKYWSLCKNEIARIIKPGGKVICFGWTSQGIGKTRGFEMSRILLVPHGGSRNDTICTVEVKL